MGHAFAEVLEKRFRTAVADLPCGCEIAGTDGVAGLFLKPGAEGGAEAQPPDGAVQDHADGEEEAGEDGPHDPAALEEGIDDDVCEHDGMIF